MIGKAVYQAAPSYIWDLGVNVVGVIIGAPDTGAAFAAGTPADGGTVVTGNTEWKIVASGSPGIRWRAKVTLNGPDGDRGVKFMRAGFVQNVDFTTNTGTYSTEGRTLTSDLQGQSFLDADDLEAPYYSLRAWAVFFDPSPSNKVKIIDEEDSPVGGPPLTFDCGIGVDPGDDVVDSMNLVWGFRLYVTVASADYRVIDAARVFTSRAWAPWTFNASVAISQTSPYGWTGAPPPGVTAPSAWIPVTDGSQPPQLSGESAGHALEREDFH